jgi:hypothetical protein
MSSLKFSSKDQAGSRGQRPPRGPGSKMIGCFSLVRRPLPDCTVSREIPTTFCSSYVMRQLSGDLLSGDRLSVDLPSARSESPPRETTGVRATAVCREPARPSRAVEPIPGRAGGHLRSAPDRDQPAGAMQALPSPGDDCGPRTRPGTLLCGRSAHGYRLSRIGRLGERGLLPHRQYHDPRVRRLRGITGSPDPILLVHGA